MIAKISNGAKFTGLANYLHGPGRENEHFYGLSEGGQVIGGNLMVEGDRDGHRWARDMNAAAAQRPDIEKPVWHMSLRAAPEDPKLSDEQWRDIAQHHAEKMGWDRQPWVMVRHGEDHVHVVVSRVDFDGKVWSRRDDRYKARAACLEVEQRYRLRSTELEAPTRAKTRTHTATPTQTRQHTVKLTQGEFAKAERTGRAPERVNLANLVRASRDHARRVGGGREAFEAALTENGVQWRANVAATGRMNGYSFHHAGHLDAAGEPVWLKASDLDRGLSWGKLSKDLVPREVPVRVSPVAPKKLLERSSTYEARVQAATVAAQDKHRAQSVAAMHKQVSTSSVQSSLFWQTRRVKKAAKVKQWAINVHDRSIQREKNREMMRRIRAQNPNVGNPWAGKTPTSATFQAATRAVDFAARAAMQQASMDRNRDRGMSR